MAVIRLHRVHELPAPTTPTAEPHPAGEQHPLPFERRTEQRWTARGRRATVTR